MGWYQFQTLIWWFLHRTPQFWHLKNRNWLFRASKRKISSCNIVSYPKMHMCAQYGHIIINYALILAITLMVWPKCHETSNMIGHICEGFFMTFAIFKVQYFFLQLWHIIWHHTKLSHCLDHFWISYAHFKRVSAFLIENGKIVNSLYS
jgi:hypothetical protein